MSLTVGMAPTIIGAENFTKDILPFIKSHCVSCHDKDKQKGDLRLDTLKPPTKSKRTATSSKNQEVIATWATVLERMEAGEMPPEKAPQPSSEAKAKIIRWIKGELERSALLATPPPTVRRLNRTEYENTVRDILSIDIQLKDLLPEDSLAHGFDTVGEGLSISSVLLEQYLETAQLALDKALVEGPRPKTIKERFSYKGERMIQRNPQIFLQRRDGVVIFDSNYTPTALKQFRAPTAGRYKFRVSATPYQSTKPLILRAYGGDLIPRDGASHLIGHYELPAGQPTIVEFEDTLEENGTIKVAPYKTGFGLRKVGASNYKDPGLLVHWIEVEGPVIEAWPPASHRELIGNVDLNRRGYREINKILLNFQSKAFRRPVSISQVAPYYNLVKKRLSEGRDMKSALRAGLTAILCSPEFLLINPRFKNGKPANKPGPLDGYSIATRLSYLFWSTSPDRELLDLARKKKLTQSKTLKEQVERMLNHPKAENFTKNFVGQWLKLNDIDFTSPDEKLYPEFDELLKYSMVKETELFFEDLLKNDLSLLNFVDSDFIFVNERLADHYGLNTQKKGSASIHGLQFQKYKLPPLSIRGGVLTQASILKVTANGTSTSPVMRGLWVNENILGVKIPPPPANVGAVEPDIRGASTIRTQLEKHRTIATCRSCHQKIDPPGFALESFDVIGGYRQNYRSLGQGKRLDLLVNHRRVTYRKGPLVNPTGKTPKGQRFRDIRDLKKIYLKNPEQIATTITEKLLVYSLGRGIHPSDQSEIKKIVNSVKRKKYGFRTLIHEIVQSPLFLER